MDQHYEPKYIYWHEKDFLADPYVSRVMRWIHRHFYRALIIASCYNSERPYLPNDDAQLWVLADAESLEQWLAHKDIVMYKFTLTEDGAHWQHKRVLADWELMLAAYKERSESGKRGGLKKASNAKQVPSSTIAQPTGAMAPSTTVLDFDFDSTKHTTHINKASVNDSSPKEQDTIKTKRRLLTVEREDDQQQTGTSAEVNTYAHVAKYLELDMLSSQWKKGEREQAESLIREHGWERFLAATILYWREQDPETFGKTLFRWSSLLDSFSGFLLKVKQPFLDELSFERWRKDHPQEYQRNLAASEERQTREIIARRDARPQVSEVSMEDFLADDEQSK